ncbi:MAG: hypothetical protein F6J86_44385, partial [Symploca sp. SIO1B1]|nr:hypothetical protein [Symploca sp. SIO1B1]
KRSEEELARIYLDKIHAAVTDTVPKRVPVTAGAGNGQGRKPSWKAGKTKAIRVPEKFAAKLLELARQWDEEEAS